MVRAPGTIPASETICVTVSPFAAEIFGCYAKILVHDLKSVKKLVISGLDTKQFFSDFCVHKMLVHHHETQLLL